MHDPFYVVTISICWKLIYFWCKCQHCTNVTEAFITSLLPILFLPISHLLYFSRNLAYIKSTGLLKSSVLMQVPMVNVRKWSSLSFCHTSVLLRFISKENRRSTVHMTSQKLWCQNIQYTDCHAFSSCDMNIPRGRKYF